MLTDFKKKSYILYNNVLMRQTGEKDLEAT